MTQAITQAAIEAAKTVIVAVKRTEIPVNTTRPVPPMQEISGLVLKQPMFKQKSSDKYLELFKLEINI